MTAYARSKLRRLHESRALVARQLEYYVQRSLITNQFLDEACVRLENSAMDRVAGETASSLTSTLTAVDPDTIARVRPEVLVGSGFHDRRTARRMRATVVPGATGSPMIAAPGAVARILRELGAERERERRCEMRGVKR